MLLLQMYHNDLFLFEILSTFITRTLIICDYPCGKEVSDNLYSGKVPGSTDCSSQNNLVSFLICCQALAGRPEIITLKNNNGTQPFLLTLGNRWLKGQFYFINIFFNNLRCFDKLLVCRSYHIFWSKTYQPNN